MTKRRRPKVVAVNVAVSQELWSKFRSMASLRNQWARPILEDLISKELSRWEAAKGVSLNNLQDGVDEAANSRRPSKRSYAKGKR